MKTTQPKFHIISGFRIDMITPEPCYRLSQYGKGEPITCQCSKCKAKNQTPEEAEKAVRLAHSN